MEVSLEIVSALLLSRKQLSNLSLPDDKKKEHEDHDDDVELCSLNCISLITILMLASSSIHFTYFDQKCFLIAYIFNNWSTGIVRPSRERAICLGGAVVSTPSTIERIFRGETCPTVTVHTARTNQKLGDLQIESTHL